MMQRDGLIPVGRLALTRKSPWAALAFLAVALVSSAGAQSDLRRDSTVQAVERAMPSVVNIATETVVETRDTFDSFLRDFWGPYYRRLPPRAQYSVGSGVIIDEEGYVLTNLHVVRRATRIWVKLSDGREFEAEPIVGATRTDVALLKIIRKDDERFQAVRFARDGDLMLGETVLALGNPFGLGGSVSRGILSSKERQQPRENEPLDVANWLQTDAAINPGNSGGPLVNLNGELIGINVAIHREGQGIGFAIPIKIVSEALSDFFTPEITHSLWFGARVKAGEQPMQVIAVQPGSPADKAGLRVADAILQVNGVQPRHLIDFNRLVTTAAPGRDVSFQVQRGGERRAVKVRLVPEKDFFNEDLIRQKLGASLQELTPELARALGLAFHGGYVISGVDHNSPAEKARLQAGFVVTGIDGRLPQDLTDAAKMLYARNPGDKVRLDLVIQSRRGNLISRQTTAVEVTVR